MSDRSEVGFVSFREAGGVGSLHYSYYVSRVCSRVVPGRRSNVKWSTSSTNYEYM